MARTRLDRETLEAALIGLQLQRDQVEKKMAELRRQVAGRDASQLFHAAGWAESFWSQPALFHHRLDRWHEVLHCARRDEWCRRNFTLR